MPNDQDMAGMRQKTKTLDPQIVVTARLKEGQQGELLVFNIKLGFFELACIVNIPAEGETTAPVYCKFKILNPSADLHRGSGQTRQDREEVREEK